MNKKIFDKIRFFIFLIGLAMSMAACSGKEAVLLEDSDLVREQGLDEEKTGFPAAEKESAKQVEESTLFVHICGEVEKPGVYELPEGSRVYEAVEEAGGFTEDAAADYVNLAQILEDGWKVEIPSKEEQTEVFAGIADDGRVDINTAAKEELLTLPGIGESRAESIIAYREKSGGFSRIEDIMKVEGIKEGMFAKMKDKICVRGVR